MKTEKNVACQTLTLQLVSSRPGYPRLIAILLLLVAAVVTAKDATGQTLWKDVVRLIPTDSYDQEKIVEESFGFSTALSGNIAVIGAPAIHRGGSGSVYVFDITTGRLLNRLVPQDSSDGDGFGVSVAISGTQIVVGSADSTVYGFNAITGIQTGSASGAANDGFGLSVSIAADGKVLVAGGDSLYAEGANGSSAVIPTSDFGSYAAFVEAANGQSLGEPSVVALLADTSDLLPYRVVLSSGYRPGNRTFDLEQTEPADFGGALLGFAPSVDIDGRYAVVGDPYNNTDLIDNGERGSAYIFDLQLETTLRVDSSQFNMRGEYFGNSVAVDFGFVVLSGANHTAVYDPASGDIIDEITPTNHVFNSEDGDFSVDIDDFKILSSKLVSGVFLYELAGLKGDYNRDFQVKDTDVDFFSGAIGFNALTFGLALDFDDDGFITLLDHDFFVRNFVQTSNGATGTIIGDINLDGRVNVLGDAFTLVANLGTFGGWAQGDLNADGGIDVLGDAFRLIGNLGQSN